MKKSVVAVGVVAVVLAGCTAAPAPTGAGSSPASTNPTSVPAPVKTRSLPTVTSGGANVRLPREGVDDEHLFTVTPDRPDGLTDSVLAVLADGSALVVRTKNDDATPLRLFQDRLFLRDKNGQVELKRPVVAGPARQTFVAASHGKKVAWLETPDTTIASDNWELFVADERRQVRHLASSRTAPTGIVSDGLVIDADRAYVTAMFPADGPYSYSKILSVPLAGGAVTTLVDDAHLPAKSAAGVHFVRMADTSRTTKEGVAEFGIVKKGSTKPEIVHTESLDKGQRVSSQCVVGDKLAWIVKGSDENAPGYLSIRDPDGSITRIGVGTIDSSPNLFCGDGLIAWGGTGGDDGQYVYSVTDGTAWKLGAVEGLAAVHLSGKTVGWTLPFGENRFASTKVVRWLR